MIVLRRGKVHFECSRTLWTMSIEMAHLCGWVPAGTLRQEDVAIADAVESLRHLLAWQVEYVCQDGQTVTGEDAVKLAAGLSRAAGEGAGVLEEWNAGRLEPTARLHTPSTGFVWFTLDEGKAYLLKLATFCEGGEFQIF